MMIRPAAFVASLLLGCATPIFAAEPEAAAAEAESDAPTVETPTPDKDRKVCRMETSTGSVMPKRVCRTVAQIEEEQRQAARYRDQQNRLGSSRP